MDQSLSHPPTSSVAVCVWIPLFALRAGEGRRPELAPQPGALLAPDASRRVVWQVSSLARHAGVRPGMTVSQAIGLCPALRLCEPDPVHYDERFARLLAALARVSPVVEPAELGLAYVGTDGLEGLYGGPEQIVEAIRLRIAECGMRNRNASAESAIHNPQSAFRVGWGKGKFVAWVAATRAKPGGAFIVPPGEEGKFLAAQPVAVLPLDPDAHRRLRQLGLRTLGQLAALPEEAIVSQFGRAGQDAPGAGAARGRRGAARRRVHRLRPGHRRAAALRPGRGCRRAGRPTARPAERRPGDHAPAQTPHAASRHRGPAMVPSSGTPLRADRL